MPSLYIAAGHHGLLLSSPDGRAWTAAPLGKEAEIYRACAGGNGRLVAGGGIGGSTIFAATTDGKDWKLQTRKADKYTRYVRGMGFGNGTFLGVGGDPVTVGKALPYVVLSPDGEAWDGPHNFAGRFMIRRVAFGNGTWVGVGDRGRRAAAPDGKTWTDAPEAKAIDTMTDVAFGNGVFVGVGLHGLRATTADGKTWTAPIRGDEGEHLNSVVWAGDRFVAVGAGVTFTSPDGAKWDRHPTTNAPLTVAYGDGVFIGPRWKGRLVRSADGVTWDEVYQGEHHIEGVAYGEVG